MTAPQAAAVIQEAVRYQQRRQPTQDGRWDETIAQRLPLQRGYVRRSVAV